MKRGSRDTPDAGRLGVSALRAGVGVARLGVSAFRAGVGVARSGCGVLRAAFPCPKVVVGSLNRKFPEDMLRKIDRSCDIPIRKLTLHEHF